MKQSTDSNAIGPVDFGSDRFEVEGRGELTAVGGKRTWIPRKDESDAGFRERVKGYAIRLRDMILAAGYPRVRITADLEYRRGRYAEGVIAVDQASLPGLPSIHLLLHQVDELIAA